jgi:methylglyoxal synthase
LVAHDHKKDELLSWVKKHREILSQHQLIATGTPEELIKSKKSLTAKFLKKEME